MFIGKTNASSPADNVSKPDSIGSKRARLSELDALRGIAALGVLSYHYTSIYPRLITHQPFVHIPQLDFGYFGVEMFFVISGFVIFFTAQRAKSVKDFALSRFARLFPAYWAAVVMTAVIQFIAYQQPLSTLVPQTTANLTMLQTFIGATNLDGSYWTLALELSFYILIAATIRVTDRLGCRIEWALLCWLAAATIIRATHTSIPYRLAVFGLLNYGQFFVLGISLFLFHSGKATKLTGLVAVWAIAMSVFGADPRTAAAGFSNGFYFAGASCAAAIVIITLRYKPAVLSTPLPQFFGAISYSLYLTHSTIGFLILRFVIGNGGNELLAISLAFIASVAVGSLLNVTVEKPGRQALARLLNPHRPSLPRPA